MEIWCSKTTTKIPPYLGRDWYRRVASSGSEEFRAIIKTENLPLRPNSSNFCRNSTPPIYEYVCDIKSVIIGHDLWIISTNLGYRLPVFTDNNKVTIYDYWSVVTSQYLWNMSNTFRKISEYFVILNTKIQFEQFFKNM